MSAVLTSSKNPRIKALAALAQAKERAARGLFALEGAREIGRALSCGYHLVDLYCWDCGLSDSARAVLAAAAARHVHACQVSQAIFAKLAVRERSDGVIAVFKEQHLQLADLPLPPTPLLLAVQGIEKPGNLGALLRSADGAGIDGVVCLDQTVDRYNPHVLRTSLGTAFSIPIVAAASAVFRDFCRSRGLRVYGAALTSQAVAYTNADFSVPCVILLGEEATGLSPDWLASLDTAIKIPMRGVADSLNVAAAGAILAYEARRQRDAAS